MVKYPNLIIVDNDYHYLYNKGNIIKKGLEVI